MSSYEKKEGMKFFIPLYFKKGGREPYSSSSPFDAEKTRISEKSVADANIRCLRFEGGSLKKKSHPDSL